MSPRCLAWAGSASFKIRRARFSGCGRRKSEGNNVLDYSSCLKQLIEKASQAHRRKTETGAYPNCLASARDLLRLYQNKRAGCARQAQPHRYPEDHVITIDE